jgi:hypothetical protein
MERFLVPALIGRASLIHLLQLQLLDVPHTAGAITVAALIVRDLAPPASTPRMKLSRLATLS